MHQRILIKTQEEIEIMAEGGKILAQILAKLENEVRPGIATRILENKARELIRLFKVKPAFLGYEGYPTALCTSVNNVVVHEVPSQRILKEGDIISLDFGIIYKGYYTDMAATVGVGKISPQAQRLIRVTKKALKRGIKKARPGNTFGDVGNTIQRYVESQGFQVVRDLCGHGIGKNLHEEPQILNYGKRHSGPKILPGMVFCLEPMVTAGDWRIKQSKDGYGWETQDGSLSAHFEHMVAVTRNGTKVLTELREDN